MIDNSILSLLHSFHQISCILTTGRNLTNSYTVT